MKRIIIFCFATVLCLSLSAQEHFKFKGVEINGSVSSFYNKLKQQIPDLKGTIEDGAGAYTGTFASKECSIFCYPNAKGNVYLIAVLFPDDRSWTSVKNSFLDYCSILTEKYGTPTTKIRRFYSPYEEGDGYEISAFHQDKATWVNMYDTDNGSVTVCIRPGSTYKAASLVLYYTDTINKNVEDQAKEKAVYDDL